MNTQNVNVKTAAQESSRKICENPLLLTILVAENDKNSTAEWDVMEFSSLAEVIKMRRSSPEQMKREYFYAVSRGVDKQFSHIHVVEACHFKQFVRQIKRQGIAI